MVVVLAETNLELICSDQLVDQRWIPNKTSWLVLIPFAVIHPAKAFVYSFRHTSLREVNWIRVCLKAPNTGRYLISFPKKRPRPPEQPLETLPKQQNHPSGAGKWLLPFWSTATWAHQAGPTAGKLAFSHRIEGNGFSENSPNRNAPIAGWLAWLVGCSSIRRRTQSHLPCLCLFSCGWDTKYGSIDRT